MSCRSATIVLLLCSVMGLAAQTAKPTFDVTSVKRNVSGGVGYSLGVRPGGVYVAGNVPLLMLIEFAYGLAPFRIVGGPEWLRTYRFDITGRAGRDAPPMEMRLMMRSLLEDRFNLIVRKELRSMSHFALVKARDDGRLGSNLKRCEASKPPEPAGNSSNEKPWVAAAASGRNCTPMLAIADLASRVLETPVIDMTGLDGGWDYSLRFSSAQSQSFGALTTDEASSRLPALPTALQEQLGLKLQAIKGPVEVLVIDSAQQPTKN